MPPRKKSEHAENSRKKSSGTKTSSGKSGDGLRVLFQRFCTLGIVLTVALLAYSIMGGDVRFILGAKTSSSSEENAENTAAVTHQTAKPILDANGHVMFQSVSEGSETSVSADSSTNGTESSMNPASSTESGMISSDVSATSQPETSSVPDSSTEQPSTPAENTASPETTSGTPSETSSVPPEEVPSASVPETSSSETPSCETPNYETPAVSSSTVPPSTAPVETPTTVSTDSTSTPSTPSVSGTTEVPPASAPLLASENAPEKIYNSNTTITGPDGKPRTGEISVFEQNQQHSYKTLNGPVISNFLELFNFDITPDWVEANWASIAVVGPLNTRGYRVPLSTGPTPSDLVGSLTYYFDNRLELEKITFEGYTGDLDRLLISLKFYNLSKRLTSDPSAILYVSDPQANGRRSFLKTYYRISSLDANNPNQKYWLTVELYPPEK